MSLRSIARQLVPPLLKSGANTVWRRFHDPARAYERNGLVPFSDGYLPYKFNLVTRTIQDPAMLARFRDGTPLPARFGVSVDERCVEYPWVFAQLPPAPATVLDAGSVLNREILLDLPLLSDKKLHILTLGPEKVAYWQRGISYLYDDLRELPVRDGYYDYVVCVSTLEHVGFDNSGYTASDAHREYRPGDFLAVMAELRRVLKPGGSLLLTVPFGVPREFATARVFDRAQLDQAIQAFRPAGRAQEAFYRYTADGWNTASAEECAASEYVDWAARWNEGSDHVARMEPDRAAAARAVACVRLTAGRAL
jgi:SAM-dependent methyltransferase